jgi:hypothetical protein
MGIAGTKKLKILESGIFSTRNLLKPECAKIVGFVSVTAILLTE